MLLVYWIHFITTIFKYIRRLMPRCIQINERFSLETYCISVTNWNKLVHYVKLENTKHRFHPSIRQLRGHPLKSRCFILIRHFLPAIWTTTTEIELNVIGLAVCHKLFNHWDSIYLYTSHNFNQVMTLRHHLVVKYIQLWMLPQ